MKTIWIIILALFTLSSCKFSYDKAKVEESYGSSSGGGGGGSCNIDPTSSSITIDASGIADGVTTFNITVTIMSDCSLPVENEPVVLSVDGNDNSSITCSNTDSSGISNCTFTSTYAENKNITLVQPAELSSLAGFPAAVTFSAPPLLLKLKACLAGDSLGLALPMTANSSLTAPNSSLPFVSPYINYQSQFLIFTNNEIAQPVIPATTAVDWVLVQLYADDATAVTPSTATPIDAKSAIIHADGSITDPSGLAGGDLTFITGLNNDYNAGYRINVIHRNHLPVGLEDPVLRTNLNIDMTLPSTNYLGQSVTASENPYITMGGSKCIRAGDFYKDPSNNTVDATDDSEIRNYLFVGGTSMFPGFPYQATDLSIPGYLQSDITLNGYSFLWSSVGGTAAEDLKAIQDNQMTAATPLWGDGAP